MTTVIPINNRGNITLPAKMRKTFCIDAETQLIAEVIDEGILLRPAFVARLDFYTEEQIESFEQEQEGLEKILKKKMNSV